MKFRYWLEKLRERNCRKREKEKIQRIWKLRSETRRRVLVILGFVGFTLQYCRCYSFICFEMGVSCLFGNGQLCCRFLCSISLRNLSAFDVIGGVSVSSIVLVFFTFRVITRTILKQLQILRDWSPKQYRRLILNYDQDLSQTVDQTRELKPSLESSKQHTIYCIWCSSLAGTDGTHKRNSQGTEISNLLPF